MDMKNETMGSFAGNAASELNDKHDSHSSLRPVIALVLALWLGLILALGARGAFVGTPGTPPLQIFLGFAVPLAVFFAGYFGWSAFRSFVLGLDSPLGRNPGMALGWLWLSRALFPRNSARPIRIPADRRHGHRDHRSVDSARLDAEPGIRGQPALCDVEHLGNR